MENIIRKGIAEQFYFSFYFNWGFYFSAGYLFCRKIWYSISSELNENLQVIMQVDSGYTLRV